ncbi:hypothetical protein EHEL_081155 [Encephalitozoon hellem ATCC 50504]|uniref:Uncharacterized protein n=1 Tax=Encephalitozoon hellem TaxID=27973 RepID=A0A9Q9F8S3_ENCHE|nr:uncharacterized protein EHEL_081155 [Encephalitozoon hellem ATCC 50504]AHL28961.1 hypothetical protein EHEL_081155 [Encephalitozoon hellem ATCC 50504]UTX43793.1 hypothetical protein GPU96_08g15670 [Encephalitozoon hellem]
MDGRSELEIKAKIRLRLLAIDKILNDRLGEEKAKELRQRIWQDLGKKNAAKSGISKPTVSMKDLYGDA